MSGRPFNTLFLCTGNSARSIMAEALLNIEGKGRFKAYSAGSFPAGRVNPYAIEIVRKIGYPVDGLHSKSWDEFAAPGAPQMDFIFTVCDNAAGEACPVWPGQPITAHWGFADPAAVAGSDEQKRHAFERVFHEINHRIQLFIALPFEKLDPMSLRNQLRKIGESRP